MTKNSKLNDAKLRLLGEVISQVFYLKPSADGTIKTLQGKKSYLGIGNLVAETVRDTLTRSEEELKADLTKNF